MLATVCKSSYKPVTKYKLLLSPDQVILTYWPLKNIPFSSLMNVILLLLSLKSNILHELKKAFQWWISQKWNAVSKSRLFFIFRERADIIVESWMFTLKFLSCYSFCIPPFMEQMNSVTSTHVIWIF